MTINGQAVTMVDGAVGVTGNPVYQACVEAFYYDDFHPNETRVVSLGTGFSCPGNQPPAGLLGWLQWTVDTLLDAPEDQQTEIVKRHFPGILQRFDWELPKPVDMADVGCAPDLVKLGQSVAASMNWPAILA
jgi:hypothetical protein